MRGLELGKVRPGVSLLSSKSGSYDEPSSVATIGEKFPQETLAQVLGKPRRGLSAD